ncbi:MAG: GtrA family protein [Candidatus Paceibacterota bacterium]
MKDYLLVSLIGFLVGWLILPTAFNLGLKINPTLILLSVIGFSALAPLVLAVVFYFSRFWPGLRQFGKFCAVGVLNTFLGFSVLNLLIHFTGITRGLYYSLFLVLSFMVSVTNSYFWNKFWSFQSQTATSPSEFSRFLLFTFIGLLINNAVASFLNNVIGPLGGIKPIVWANVSAFFAIAFSFLWNFFSYRFWIFKKPQPQDKQQQIK